jgi:hypothetical protein
LSDSVAALVRILRFAAVIAATFVFLSFAAFVYDEVKSGSEASQASIGRDVRVQADPSNINIPDPDPALERLREREHSDVREFIDDANDVLVAPFTGLIDDSDSIWQQRLVTTGLALLLYGGIILLIANYLPKKRSRKVTSMYDAPPARKPFQ